MCNLRKINFLWIFGVKTQWIIGQKVKIVFDIQAYLRLIYVYFFDLFPKKNKISPKNNYYSSNKGLLSSNFLTCCQKITKSLKNTIFIGLQSWKSAP